MPPERLTADVRSSWSWWLSEARSERKDQFHGKACVALHRQFAAELLGE